MVSSKVFVPMLFALAVIGGASSTAMKALRFRDDETAVGSPFAETPQHHRRRRLKYVGGSYDYKAMSACDGNIGKAGKGGKSGTANQSGKSGKAGKGGKAVKGGKADGPIHPYFSRNYWKFCDDGEDSMHNPFEKAQKTISYPKSSPTVSSKAAPIVQKKEVVIDDQDNDDQDNEDNVHQFEQLVNAKTVLVHKVVAPKTKQNDNAGTTQTNDAGTSQTNNAGPAQTNNAGTAQTNGAGTSQTNDVGTAQTNSVQTVQGDDDVPSNDDPKFRH